MLRRLLKSRVSGNVVEMEKPRARAHQDEGDGLADVIVLASGNLGIISFPRWSQRMSLEELNANFPRLIPGLIAHPGISLALVQSQEHGPLAIGKEGIYHLQSGEIDGEDPLMPYGPHAARHLLRTAGFANVPDVLVISAMDPVSGEVPAFEELVGNVEQKTARRQDGKKRHEAEGRTNGHRQRRLTYDPIAPFTPSPASTRTNSANTGR
jgi:hypothetical protein